MRNWQIRLALGGAAVVAVLLAPGAGAAGKGGAIQIYMPGTTSTRPILVTGAITDYGKATSVTEAGKPTGSYIRIVLKRGTFLLDGTALAKKTDGSKPTGTGPCYDEFKFTGPMNVMKGTGAYAGIRGIINMTFNAVVIAPILPNGKCKQSLTFAAQYEDTTGSGTVRY